jgi:ribosome-associated toxin RatA of RatAB toxin-antitoxin module
MAETVKETIDIEAGASDIFEVATDFESYPDWQPNFKKVEVKATDDEGRPTEVFFEVDARVRKVKYTLEYDYSKAPGSFSWDLVEGDVKKLKGSYAFDEQDDVTEVTYQLQIDPGFPVPGPLKRQAERQIVSGALKDLKKRVEGGAS